ncbi:hypothetical protein TVAG_093480 [Trichomonas vaginalis G3]|uniref:Uncharacterized protein n=1 Tax=Trichomonas vaginalis (strain ATCC PRA-98 / G3) TaxID=412133 RepID=A2DBH1_TRIV3|nr:hypothetical protein TVAGG3_0382310 [Trichomonas vaginalis G3]EAY22174.1 hypothetical protein TVAG_093480 [Trichomonas vaginalis G3]KAI5533368.1 hypothetical protein TVAGG3_0382310 [Trichomonas vaginalis G3]|eukprot:XP_001583160.1 hypothetical protein [Trichomonas vaginalis G3]
MHDDDVNIPLSYDDPRFQFEKEDEITLDKIAKVGKPQKRIINPLFNVPQYVEFDEEIIENFTLAFKLATLRQCRELRGKYYHQDIYE